MALEWSMQQKHDTAANWLAENPVLLIGQIGIETDTNKLKLGTGANWNDTVYFGGGSGTNNLVETQSWFDANPTYVLELGQIAFLEQTGRYKLGDGVIQLQSLPFLGSGGGVRFDSNSAGFPVTGEIEVIYVAKDTGLMYQWNGVAYVELSANSATELPSLPPIFSGKWRGATGTTYSTASFAANQVYVTPYLVCSPHTVLQIRVPVTTGVASQSIRMALYSSDANGYPDALIEQSGAISVATSGEYSYTFASALSLTGKLVFMAINCTSTGVVFRLWTGPVNLLPRTAGNPPVAGYRFAHGFGSFPANFPGGAVETTNGNQHMLELLVQ